MRFIALVAMTLMAIAPAGPSRADATNIAADAANQFAVNLYGKLAGTSPTGNLFCSPLSIYGALMMTRAGAAGATAAEMDAALNSPPGDTQAIVGKLLADSAAPPGGDFTCHIAGALWAQNGFDCLPSFRATLADDYHSEFFTVDFNNPAAASQQINSWVSTQTAGKIPGLFSPGSLPAQAKLVLANAIYFYADWESPFPPEGTAEREFQIPGQSTPQQRMSMHKIGAAQFMQGDGFKAMQLNYKDGQTSMLILLPDAVDGLPKLEAKFSPQMLGDVLAKLEQSAAGITIPKFEFSQQLSLPQTLKSMGIQKAFTPGEADFSRMDGKTDLFLSDVVHKAYVAVNEKGTEAAAATGAVMMPTAIPMVRMEFVADHPFMFLIRNQRTGAILFIGRVWDPQ